MKDFDKWNKVKKRLDERVRVPFCHEREIWWVSIGLNIGSEQDGKSELYERPVLVLRVFNREMVKIAPMTSMYKDKAHVSRINYKGKDVFVLIQHVRTISSKRLNRKFGRLDEGQFRSVVESYLASLLKRENPLV